MLSIILTSPSKVDISGVRVRNRQPKSRRTKSSVQSSWYLRCASIFVVITHFLTLQPVLVCAALAAASSTPSLREQVEARPIQAPAKNPNRTLPVIEPAASEHAAFSNPPTDKEIMAYGGFTEQLVPIGGKTTAADNKAIGTFLQGWRNRTNPEDFALITGFISAHPKSPWATALLINKGLDCRRLGYFSQALEAWQQAWKRGESETSAKGRFLMDRAAGELAELNARLGRYD
jgi:hypothetical protein